ncbi:tRNA(Ile)(2)-agmatinylcytidine synthase [Candidatus Bathycorpusculum sp.]|uniref:tRNA(Ile)(2)-agmatinylcytidine synthase n=1 Tax=Candidatus Bathycorpusculum sp. TaxID=2994959 RepID=UPI0028190C3E|nr:tRNA(Ile)(2)-agmatinylcytidine synthase [Candidatus Termitimicrobium sp.]MCL2686591.1 tRNA(Ile)(2)-agmatinylcytidine synthase [Candidatus Termitimicrobium sp.]
MTTSQTTMHIGLDDTDSTKGGCTTYLTALLIEEFKKFNVTFLDYPLLIRLNPNVPWKTRGNGALCLRFSYNPKFRKDIKKIATQLWEEHSAIDQKGTDPGIVFFNSATIPEELKEFTKKTQTTIVTQKEAQTLIKKIDAEAQSFNSGRGIIGALAAIGETLQNKDYTYELITYRIKQNWGTKRQIDQNSIFEMDKTTAPHTFNNIDPEKGRVIITPRGPDPILFGIRGESPQILQTALNLVKPQEPIERWVIFRSNQGTDAHLNPTTPLAKLVPYCSVIAKGTVAQSPRIIPRRHVIFSIADGTTEVDCAAYEPTGTLRKTAWELRTGDTVEVYGAVHKATATRPLTINLEKIKVLTLQKQIQTQNPLCPNCKKRLKSMGKNQGFRCEKCNIRFPDLKKQETNLPRTLTPGLYITSTRSQRHLTKPLRRYGQEKSTNEHIDMVECWSAKSAVE